VDIRPFGEGGVRTPIKDCPRRAGDGAKIFIYGRNQQDTKLEGIGCYSLGTNIRREAKGGDSEK